jgi:hypothetical protein
MTHWSQRRRVAYSVTALARERVDALASHHNITPDEAADALIRALDYHEAAHAVLLVLEEDRRAREEK